MNHEFRKKKIVRWKKKRKKKLNYITIMYTTELVHVMSMLYHLLCNPNFVIYVLIFLVI